MPPVEALGSGGTRALLVWVASSRGATNLSSNERSRVSSAGGVTKILFEPFPIRSVVLPSRILFAPINTGFTRLGRPTKRLVSFHVERSGPSIGVSIVGNVAVEPDARANAGTALLTSETPFGRYA